jgi:hypothetical protein
VVAVVIGQVFRPSRLHVVVLRKVVVEWLFGLFRRSELRSIARDRRPKVPSRASFWVAFHGCSLEHTNGGRQCWGLIAEGYGTPTRKEWKLSMKAESGTKSKVTVNNPPPPPMGAHERLFIGEVKGLVTMP